MFAFTKSSDLQDSTLSSACSLHTASASLKSSNDSLPQRGLAGITEDASETPPDIGQHSGVHEDIRRDREDSSSTSERTLTRPEKVNDITSADDSHYKSLSHSQSPLRPRTTSNTDKALPPTPDESERENFNPGSTLDYETRPSVDTRISSQSTRPTTRDLQGAYEYKPKVKLGPRPSMESAGRPDGSSTRDNDFRPVSTLPAGLRMPARKAVPSRPKSQQSQTAFPGKISLREAHHTAPMMPVQLPERKPSTQSKGLPTPTKTPEPKSPKMTPEKRRLMKALQLRQKQMAAQKEVNGLGIESLRAEPEYPKPEIDDTILSAIVDASSPAEDSDVMHVVIRDLTRDEPRNKEGSPISLPEPSDGPSTQASSITDEDENIAHDQEAFKEHEANVTSDHKISEKPYVLEEEAVGPDPAQGIGEQDVVSVPRGDGTIARETPLSVEERVSLAPSVLAAHARSLTMDEEERAHSPIPGNELSQTSSEENKLITADGGAKVLEASPAMNRNTVSADVRNEGGEGSITSETSALANRHGVETSGTSALQQTADGFTTLPQPERSSVFIAVNVHFDSLKPQEVPLPPIDEDEEISLSPQRTSFGGLHTVSKASSKPQTSLSAGPPQSKRQSHDSEQTVTRTSTPDTTGDRQTERQTRRQGLVNPIKRVSSPEQSDEHFLSDDSLMEELKSATVQEAKPISVSKSPIKPVFSRSSSEQRPADATRAPRSVSSPLDHPSNDEEVFASPRLLTPLSARSFSASHPQRPDFQQAPVPLPKKIGVSSGISQRIKALEKLSSRPTSPSSQPSQLSSPNASPFINLRQTSLRTPPGTSDIKHSNTNKSRPSTAYPSPSPSPEAVKSNPFNYLNKAVSTRPESISVTATIVRDSRNKSPEAPLNLSEPQPMNLHQSPLVVEHQTTEPRPLSPLKPPRPRYARYSSTRSGSTSSTEQKSEPPQTTRRDSFASKRSASSRAGSEVDLPRTLSDSSLNGFAILDGVKEEKKDTRRSRLMKRMSSISSMSRRSIAHALSPGPKEDPIIERQEPIAEAPSTMVDVGDVNIQFPDTLVGSSRASLYCIC